MGLQVLNGTVVALLVIGAEVFVVDDLVHVFRDLVERERRLAGLRGAFLLDIDAVDCGEAAMASGRGNLQKVDGGRQLARGALLRAVGFVKLLVFRTLANFHEVRAEVLGIIVVLTQELSH